MPAPLPLVPIASLRRYLGDHGAHAHEHAQVLFGVGGMLEVEVDGRPGRVDASAGLVVPPGARHASASRRGASVWVIDTPAGPGLERLRAFAPPARWSTRTDAADLLAAIAAAPRVLARRRLETAQVDEALAGRLHEDWPNARLAAVCALSVARFHARWLALTGLAPQAWLRAHRLDVAASLLRAGVPLETTALQVGYRSASALGVALRRERGVGARALRR